MATCCGARRCTCTVTAGPGVTVTGDGGTTSPYVISADGGGTVSCDDVRSCLSAGDGIDYDSATGEISARVSADADNQTTIGTDGGLYTPAASIALQAADSATVDVTVTGTGTPGDPYQVGASVVVDSTPPGGGTNLLQEGADGLYVECADVRECLTAGDGVDYDPGTGEISARASTDPGNALAFGSDGGLLVTPGAVSCDDVRPCLSAGDGVDYDPVTGVISARPSADAGNTLAFGADGGLLVPPPTAPPLATDCGLTGDGSAGDPLAVAAQAWPYPCDVDDNAGGVYCDSAGQLRSEPRGIYDFTQQHIVTDYPTSPLVPSATNTVVLTRDFVVDNPDPCREAAMFVELEVDIDFDLPAGSGAAGGIATDSMQYIANRGTSAATDVHQQSTKVYNELPIPAGGSTTVTLNVSLGRGSGGAMFNRIQTFIRCFVIVL